MFPSCDNLIAALGFMAGILFALPLAIALAAGGFGWWSLLALPAAPLFGVSVGALLDLYAKG